MKLDIGKKLFIVLGIAIAAYLLISRPSDPIERIAKCDIPIYAISDVTHIEYGGTFSQYLFARLELSAEHLNGYRRHLPTGSRLNTSDGIQILVHEMPDAELMKYSGQDVRFKQSVNGAYLPWWTIDKIENGTYHFKDQGGACSYETYIDDDEQAVYIYWRYS